MCGIRLTMTEIVQRSSEIRLSTIERKWRIREKRAVR
jgi:hypothetical protein